MRLNIAILKPSSSMFAFHLSLYIAHMRTISSDVCSLDRFSVQDLCSCPSIALFIFRPSKVSIDVHKELMRSFSSIVWEALDSGDLCWWCHSNGGFKDD
ncbi:uncharacterized protein LOC131158106 isoform X2 [Malania oleifera]|uniref:uncharacterized protein LOC131158106 isoform X2 n=1 Tax=Malania oleifera TaxID=397392 RepID=UPI0025AE811D|nr:uncharacterized protein LOC131158106 isoform X2 [Malania oleifera]